jgi:hypothetical protein
MQTSSSCGAEPRGWLNPTNCFCGTRIDEKHGFVSSLGCPKRFSVLIEQSASLCGQDVELSTRAQATFAGTQQDRTASHAKPNNEADKLNEQP